MSVLVMYLQDEEFLYLVMEYLPGGDVMVRQLLSSLNQAA